MKKFLLIVFFGAIFFYSFSCSYAQENLDTLENILWQMQTEIDCNPNRFLNNAYKLYKEKKYLEALKLYNIYIDQKPNYAMPFYERSLIKYALGDNNGALSDYKESLKLGLKTIEISKFKDKPVDIEKATSTLSKSPNNKNDDFYYVFGNRRDLITYENNRKNHNNEGLSFLRYGDYTNAIKHLQIAIKATPNNYVPYYNLSLALFKNMQYNQSLDILSDYIDKIYKYTMDEKGIYNIKNLQKKCLLITNQKEEALKIGKKYDDFFTISYFEILNNNYAKAKKILKNEEKALNKEELKNKILEQNNVSSIGGNKKPTKTRYILAEILNNVAYIEYLNNEFSEAYIDINKAKKIALEWNDVDLYMNTVKLETLIIGKISSEEKNILDNEMNKTKKENVFIKFLSTYP